MKVEYKLRPVRISVQEMELTLDELPDLVKKRISPKDAWLLLETPRKVLFRPFAGLDDMGKDFTSLIIFGPLAEIRMEKMPHEDRGPGRAIWHDEAGGEWLMRRQKALLREKDSGCVIYGEYFRESESGFLEKIAGRLCGVEGRP